MQGLEIRERLRSGRRVFGTHVTSMMNPVAARMATEVDLDFAFFCAEHMPLDRSEISWLCQYYSARGISPIVRVPSVDVSYITSAVDGGAEGIVVPYVETVQQVRDIVGAVKYRPIKGQLLDSFMSGKGDLPGKTGKFVEDFNKDQYVIIGIESVAAIGNLERLLEAADVDGVFLGPHDITATMGIPTEYRNPAFIDLVEDVMIRCRKAGVGVGIHTALLKLDAKVLDRFFAAGMNWVINGSDITAMRDAMNDQLHRLRELCGDEIVRTSLATIGKVESCIT